MAVDARELAGLLDGDGGDASAPLADDQYQPMPSGDDEVELSDPQYDAEAAPEAADDAAAEPLDEQAWKRRESELAAKHDQELGNLRSIKDRESSGWRTVADTSEQKYANLLAVTKRLLSDISSGQRDADPRDIIEIEQRLNHDQRQALARAQQQQVTGEQWVQQQHAGHQRALAQLGRDDQGRPLAAFNPNDPEIAAAFNAHLAAPNSQQAWDDYNRVMFAKREAAIRVALTKGAQRQQAQQNRAKGQARGAQNVARGGGGAPINKDAAWDIAVKQHPGDRGAAALTYERLIQQHNLTE